MYSGGDSWIWELDDAVQDPKWASEGGTNHWQHMIYSPNGLSLSTLAHPSPKLYSDSKAAGLPQRFFIYVHGNSYIVGTFTCF